MTYRDRQLVNEAYQAWQKLGAENPRNPLREAGEWAMRYAGRLLAILAKDDEG